MKSRRLDTLALVAGALLLWQALHWIVGPNVISAPIATIARAIELLQTRSFWDHAVSTATAFGVASVIAILAGIVLGLWLGLRRFAGDVADPILGTLYSIPKITLYPLILLIFGLGISAKIAFGVIHGIFPIAIFTMNAVRNVAPVPRTDAVVELLERRESGGELDEAAHTIVQRAVAEIVSRQVEIGIDVVSDGETAKMSYATYVKDRLTGFSEEGPTKAARPHLDVAPFPDFQRKMELLTGARRFKRVSCVGPVAVRDRAALQRDLVNMKLATARVQPIDAFLNAASPGVVASFLPNQYYTSHEAYVEAVANAMSEEYRAIVTAGFVIQIDCPDLAMSRHTAFQDLTEAEFLKRAQFHVEALNHALAGIPSDKVRIHVCWGNYEGPHTHDIDLAKILKTILALNAQGLSLEAANPRHEHEWTIWRDIKLPADKVLLPGVIDTSTNYVEHPDLVAQRIVRFAELVGRARVIASTDCGFGTSAGYGKIDPEIAFLKLGALVAGAARASKHLW
jgi:5-methyltetrahydropteroyltriglutamate--homocysteine methyltransferase